MNCRFFEFLNPCGHECPDVPRREDADKFNFYCSCTGYLVGLGGLEGFDLFDYCVDKGLEACESCPVYNEAKKQDV